MTDWGHCKNDMLSQQNMMTIVVVLKYIGSHAYSGQTRNRHRLDFTIHSFEKKYKYVDSKFASPMCM